MEPLIDEITLKRLERHCEISARPGSDSGDIDWRDVKALLGGLNPRQLFWAETNIPIVEKGLAYLLWTVSDTWGFEYVWNCEYMLPPEERMLEGDDAPPPQDKIYPADMPFRNMDLWAPGDAVILRSQEWSA